MIRLGRREADTVSIVGAAAYNPHRRVDGLRVVEYSVLPGCLGAYYAECNVPIPVSHHAELSHVPAGKSVPVRVERAP